MLPEVSNNGVDTIIQSVPKQTQLNDTPLKSSLQECKILEANSNSTICSESALIHHHPSRLKLGWIMNCWINEFQAGSFSEFCL